MRFHVIVCLIGAAFAHSEVERSIVKRAVEDAEEWYKIVSLNSTINGANSNRRGTKMTPFSKEMEKISHVHEKALEILSERHEMKVDDAIELMTRQGALPPACQQPPINNCINSKYRTIDGTCNNVNNPRLGSANTPMTRLLTSNYEDRVGVPRGGFPPRSRLPNPRAVSVTIHPDQNIFHQSVTNAIPVFGQFLDHDISMTPEGNRGCCANSNQPDCGLQIPVNQDAFFSRAGQTCMDFTRSTAWCFATSSRVREQINVNTAFIDASQVYASTQMRARALRSSVNGLMKASPIGFLPPPTDVTRDMIQGQFVAGDDRINENPALTTMHNLFLREHNRIAREFKRLQPNWNDERIYQETRRIVGAELTHITYNEYLPILMGSKAMNDYSLWSTTTSQYNPNVDPTVINSFATAAYRFGHSMVNGVFRMFDVNGGSRGSFNIRDSFFNPLISQANGQTFDWIMCGMQNANCQAMDQFVTGDLTNFLFRAPGANFGSDLVARNIQRGRDHGLPSWNEFRALCGLPRVTSFLTAPAGVNARALNDLSRLYSNVNDVDLFTGGLIELPYNGGITGATFQCIKGRQFQRLKYGDRFFFTHNGVFTPAQLTEIRKRTLGAIMCDNGQLRSTLANVFLINSPKIACGDRSRTLNVAAFAV